MAPDAIVIPVKPIFLSLGNIRFLCFGFLAAVFSSFGQTFFIALSSAGIRTEFSLGHGDFGLLYAIGTVSSASLLIWLGRKIDDVDLRVYTGCVIVGLGLACIGMSQIVGPVTLVIVVFALRLTGQGLMSHIAFVSMGRYFDAHRGKAVSVASMGFPAGEAIFPIIAVSLMAMYGWRDLWLALGGVILFGLFPLLLFLLRGHSARHADLVSDNQLKAESSPLTGWTRKQVLRDPRFYALIPSILVMPFVGTGFFFHQVHLVNEKGWSLTMFAGFFVLFAAVQIGSAIVSGLGVDRWGAIRLVRFFLFPACCGLVVLALSNAPLAGALFMAFCGLTAGASTVIGGAIWAEIYGIRHLGAIKALGWALMVFASALSPPVMGLAIDQGVTMNAIAWASVGLIVFAAGLANTLFPRFQTNQSTSTD